MRRAPVLTHNRQTPAFIFYTALKGIYPRPFIRGTHLRRRKDREHVFALLDAFLRDNKAKKVHG
jgi:hypothetical protein